MARNCTAPAIRARSVPEITVKSNTAAKRHLASVPRNGNPAADYEAGQRLAERIRGLMLDRQDGTLLRDIAIGMVERGSFGMVEAGFLDEIAVAAMLWHRAHPIEERAGHLLIGVCRRCRLCGSGAS